MVRKLLSNNMWDNNPAIPLAFEGDDTNGYAQVVSGINQIDSYVISDLDEAGATKYYGFLDASGNWYILQLTTTAARYIKGATDYATNWTNRAGLTYDYYNVIF
jgi:hypothetical protein